MPRISKPELLMTFAVASSMRSTCRRLRVGCVLSDVNGEQISFGYNGGPKGGRNDCARETPGQCGCIHAEMNAVIKAPRGLTHAFVTNQPCEMCATALINYGIKVVFFLHPYRDQTGLNLLRDSGIETVEMEAFGWAIQSKS